MIRKVFKGAAYAVLMVAVVTAALYFSQPNVSADGGQWNRGRSSIWAEWEFLNNITAAATSAWLFKGTTEFDGTANFDGAADFDGATTFDSTIDVQSQTITATGATIEGSGSAILDGFGKTVTSIATATTETTLTLATVDEIIYVLDGRSADLTITLPEASTWVGHTYTIINANDQSDLSETVSVDIAAADKFLQCDAAGDSYSCSTLGGTVIATAINYTDIATVSEETWADGN